jgi:hypothetical protein
MRVVITRGEHEVPLVGGSAIAGLVTQLTLGGVVDECLYGC